MSCRVRLRAITVEVGDSRGGVDEETVDVEPIGPELYLVG